MPPICNPIAHSRLYRLALTKTKQNVQKVQVVSIFRLLAKPFFEKPVSPLPKPGSSFVEPPFVPSAPGAQLGGGSKNRYQNGTASGTLHQNPRFAPPV